MSRREDFVKETDILDVWFVLGVSHPARSCGRASVRNPASRGRYSPQTSYVEGHDQHRVGWFQSSLLTSVALYGDVLPIAAW